MCEKLLLLGSSGMLGSYISQQLETNKFEIIDAARTFNPAINFNNPNKVISYIDEVKPDIVINAVAIISLDYCENNPEEADQVNGLTPGLIAEYCNNHDIYFIQISTDHFFHGNGRMPQRENGPVELLNHYARSKFLAEKKILHNKTALILRTSIIGQTSQQRSFLDWAIKNINLKENIDLFDDSYSSFLHCNQFVSILQILISKKASGLYNVGSSDVFSKAEFVIMLANKLDIKINYTLSSVKNLNIDRANSCGLSTKKIENDFGIRCPSIEAVLNCVVSELKIKN
jgi:dTDP-4-dehydrorhamnose reductase